nr:Grx4 family monothiol glutaredoxin [Immundisolibacter sp.]
MVMDVLEKIDRFVNAVPVVLFMKGDRRFPQCGFSGKAVQMLDACGVEYETVNVLADDELRQAIKVYSNWPTIPQLYVGGEFIGGADIMQALFETGELQELLESVQG